MAKSDIPDPLARRHLIEKDLDAAQSIALADAYLEAGRSSEAIPFLVKAGADDRLEEMMAEAVSEGDAFLLKQLAHVTRTDPGSARWLELADHAEAAGKLLYAESARRHARAGDE
jgi:hypothetical protein